MRRNPSRRLARKGVTVDELLKECSKLTLGAKLFSIGAEVHAGWCPPGTSNPVDLPLVDRSVRFRHTSANSIAPTEMSRRRKLKPFRAAKEVKRRARTLVGSPPPVHRHESPKRRPAKHRKREWEQELE